VSGLAKLLTDQKANDAVRAWGSIDVQSVKVVVSAILFGAELSAEELKGLREFCVLARLRVLAKVTPHLSKTLFRNDVELNRAIFYSAEFVRFKL
jgi:hypothetical protein